MSAGHGHEDHGHHVDFDKYNALLAAANNVPDDDVSELALRRTLETLLKADNTGHWANRESIAWESISDAVAGPQGYIKLPAEKVSHLKQAGQYTIPETGETINHYDSFIQNVSGIVKSDVHERIREQGKFKVKKMVKAIEDIFTPLVQRRQNRVIQSGINSNESAAGFVDYLREASKEGTIPGFESLKPYNQGVYSLQDVQGMALNLAAKSPVGYQFKAGQSAHGHH